MAKKASLLATQRAQNTILWQEGYSECMIASKLHCSNTAVRTAKIYFMKYRNYKDRKRKGGPRKSAPRDNNTMKRIVACSPTSFCQKSRPFLSQKDTEISLQTISRRRCDQFPLKLYKPARKPRLNLQMKMKRLAFAKKYESWTAEDWVKLCFRMNRLFNNLWYRKDMLEDLKENDLRKNILCPL